MDQAQIDALRTRPVSAFDHLIDGRAVPASDGGRMKVISPIDGTELSSVAEDMLEEWSRTRRAPRHADWLHHGN